MTNLPFIGKFKVTCEFKRKGSWSAGWHTGIDLVGLTNTNVYSVSDGKVIMAKYYGAYGKAVKVRIPDGRIILYAHLKNISVKTGQAVTRATKIGVMGNTGNSHGAHLHIEIRTKADKYAQVENIADYMRIPNRVGSYDSANYQIGNSKNSGNDFIKYAVHIQNIGWQDEKSNGQVAGTEGQGLRIESIIINCSIPIQYRVHVQDKGWTNYVPNGCKAGTEGESLRIEAVEIISSSKEIIGKAHIESLGWTDEKKGSHIILGTEGKGLRMEALKLKLA